jgi:hypothetical protein
MLAQRFGIHVVLARGVWCRLNWAACPVAVSGRLLATAVTVARASRHRGVATVTWCVWRVSCGGSGLWAQVFGARPLLQA